MIFIFTSQFITFSLYKISSYWKKTSFTIKEASHYPNKGISG
ncbi:hypothetical protein C1A50_0921 [Paenibacillus polymyxa]|nr:hypothetical protein C1A50_0921 [Paenibacillus polymyxa]